MDILKDELERRTQQQAPTPAATASTHPHLLSAALSPYAAAQQLLLARAAMAAGAVQLGSANGSTPAQFLLPNGATPAAAQAAAQASPYSYLMSAAAAAQFSPFCLPLNDATLAAVAAAAAGGGPNQAAMAAAIANAGLLVPQTALASAAAAQLLCQQGAGGGFTNGVSGTTTAGILIQGAIQQQPQSTSSTNDMGKVLFLLHAKKIHGCESNF